MAKRIISRAEGGLVREPPADRPKVVRPTAWLLTHYTGGDESVNDGKSDRTHMAELAEYARNAGKEWEYNYVITAPNGDIWEMAGEYRGAHSLGINETTLSVQMNLGVGAAPNQAMIDSHRWLREELQRTGQWTGQENVPHYRFRSTACPGNMMAEPPGATWNSPTGEGRLGNLLPFMVAPYTESGGMYMSGTIVKATSGAYWYSTGTLKKRLETAREINLMRLMIGRHGGNSADYENVTDAEVAAYFGVDIDVLNSTVANGAAAASAAKAAADAANAASVAARNAAQAAQVAAEAARESSGANLANTEAARVAAVDAQGAAVQAALKADEAVVAATAAKDAAEAIEAGHGVIRLTGTVDPI